MTTIGVFQYSLNVPMKNTNRLNVPQQFY